MSYAGGQVLIANASAYPPLFGPQRIQRPPVKIAKAAA
jgi:hypothetical protein